MRQRLWSLGVLGAVILIGARNAAAAETSPIAPPIAGYGKTVPVANAGERPDPSIDYKVVMSVTKAGEANAPPPALEKAARLVNLLAESGVSAAHRHIVVVLHGAATLAVLNEAGERARNKAANPSAEIVDKLTAAGVSVHVCGQALAFAKISQSEVLPGINVDLSALTTLSTLELQGYALIPD